VAPSLYLTLAALTAVATLMLMPDNSRSPLS
jgi:hypothetical protein